MTISSAHHEVADGTSGAPSLSCGGLGERREELAPIASLIEDHPHLITTSP